MKKIGLFFGTFNPVHIGHLVLANHFAEHTDLAEIWLVVTPQNPFKQKIRLLPNRQRFEMVYLATESYPKLKPSDIEFDLPKPNYTSDTLVYLEEKFPGKKFSLIIGEDNLVHFHKWKNYEVLLERYGLYVYPRKNDKPIPKQFINHPKVRLVDAPEMEISSSKIRTWVKEGKNVRPLLPFKSWQYLDEMNFYT